MCPIGNILFGKNKGSFNSKISYKPLSTGQPRGPMSHRPWGNTRVLRYLMDPQGLWELGPLEGPVGGA